VIVAWVALGLVAVCIAYFVVWIDLKGKFDGDLASRLNNLDERMGEFDARLDVLKGAVEERVSEFLADGYSLGDRVDRLTARLDAQPEPEEEFTPLDEEQKRDLRVVWASVACGHCGMIHPGLCPRVKEMRYQANGNPERIIFWPNGKWAVPKGAHSYREVFGTEVPPQATEETK
jgi:hypothetical protein